MEISFLVISSGFSNWSRIWEESWPWPQTCYLQQSKRLFFQGCRCCYLELMWVSLAWVCERWGLLGRPAPLWAVWCAWHLLWEALMGTRNKNTSLLIVRMLFHNIWRYPYTGYPSAFLASYHSKCHLTLTLTLRALFLYSSGSNDESRLRVLDGR